MSHPTDEAELARLDQAIATLANRAEQARQAWIAADAALRAAQWHRAELVRRIETQRAAPAAPSPPPTPPALVTPSPIAVARRETSTRTVQTVLFILGGLLLCAAAVVFTAVAWYTYGVRGRAVILAVVTALALCPPLVALRRRLRATAETFACVGLLLVVLDGYAAWYVNLLDVTVVPATSYAAAVCTATAAVAFGYRALTGLVAPRLVSAIAVQPVLALLAVEWKPSASGWAVVFAGSAALNLLLVAGRASMLLRVVGWIFFSSAVPAAVGAAAVAEVSASTPITAAYAGVATVVGPLVLAVAAGRTRSPSLLCLSACLVSLSTAIAVIRFAGITWREYVLVVAAGVIAAMAVLGSVASRVLSAHVRTGLVASGYLGAGGLSVYLAPFLLVAAVGPLRAALPIWHGNLAGRAWLDWQALAAVGFATLAFAVLAPRAARPSVVVSGATLAVLALPGAVALPWWAPATLDAAVATLLAVSAVVLRRNVPGVAAFATPPGVAAAVPTVHGVAAGLARPALTAGVLGGLVVAGVMVSRLVRSGAPPSQRVIGGTALAVGLGALPPAVGSLLAVLDVPVWWRLRATTAAVGIVLVAVAVVRQQRWYAYAAAVVSALVWPMVGAVSGIEPVACYAGVGLLALALAMLAASPATPMRLAIAASIAGGAAVAPAGVLAFAVLSPLLAVVVLPYTWLDAVWSGAPAGIGLSPVAYGLTASLTWVAAVGLALLAVATGVAAYAVTGRLRHAVPGLAAGLPAALLVGLAAAEAAWPAVPAVTLALGIGLLLASALSRPSAWAAVLLIPQGVAFLGAGLAGALSAEWTTLAALGSTVVAGVVAGAVGRHQTWRFMGWLSAAVLAIATAVAAAFAADLQPHQAAFAVLAAAAAVLVVGVLLAARRRRWDGAAVQAAAHAGAVVSLLLTVNAPRHCAAVCALWGVAVGLRALWPATSATARSAYAAAAGGSELIGWWLLLASAQVSLVEAYTLPLAVMALVAGWAAMRGHPELRSWIAYGPALAAAFLPSLASVVSAPGNEWRRLLLGLGSLAVVIAGSVRRLQAPVVLGGGVLAVVVLHELVLIWDRTPRWIPLAVGGLLLVGLAVTYERRLRDLARLRSAVSRMR